MKLILLRELDYEYVCNRNCDQWGTGVLITTNQPHLVEDRLNKGFPYRKGNPRYGDRTRPLAFFDDWFFCQSWDIVEGVSVTTLPEFRRKFERPCINANIERRLMQDDNQRYPTLRAKDMSKNGLDCTFCLKNGTYPTLEEITRTRFTEYQEYLTNCVITQVDDLLGELGIIFVSQEDAVSKITHIEVVNKDSTLI